MKERLYGIWNKFVHLEIGFRLLLYMVTVVVCAVTIWYVATHPEPEGIMIRFYVTAAMFLTASVFHLVKDIHYIKAHVVKPMIYKNQYTNKVVSDYRFRTLLFTIPGVMGNILFAAVNAVNGIIGRSAWFGSLSAYYILLSMMRMNLVQQEKRIYQIVNLEEKKQKENTVYFFNSILFIIMAGVLAGLIILLAASNGGKEYPGFTIYVMAAYVFYRFIMCSFNIVRVKKENSLLLTMIRRIGYVDASVSILTLQTAMFAAFSNGDALFEALMTGVVGFAICLLVFGFGIQGIRVSRKEKKKYDSYISSGR